MTGTCTFYFNLEGPETILTSASYDSYMRVKNRKGQNVSILFWIYYNPVRSITFGNYKLHKRKFEQDLTGFLSEYNFAEADG